MGDKRDQLIVDDHHQEKSDLGKRARCLLLTGGIASGKTFVSDYLASKGAMIIDTDQISRSMTQSDNEQGRAALAEIRAYFGADLFTESGELDRAKMRALIFNDLNAKQQLEAILHGRIRSAVEKMIAEAENVPYIVVVVPVIDLKSPYLFLCDEVLVVEVPYQLQLQRLMARDNIDQALAEKIINAQISRLDRRKLGNHIIINENNQFVKRQLDKLHQHYIEPIVLA
ncbi:dephospho-CoA kinase [Ignatzschineria cameli]|uniref:Dephospho-CoA kinase n=1 Tax=Ignatzschineria cameli TaxID=2182793 RepID=A0A2U2AQ99_9GAMM|nr:dephospho-CoA kinase [Ignatzschineria cameli]PWD83291.1 dephospho-CoA kinase [Ignatzschineria cameli]PWD85738.1 dephospho-CoA kinase [Ignatzschineria cameli]PWD89367.1 dephospho-CoA kinase [Ignatzschineria cameli]PWD90839.1 dephospho-CoA kinase [Ignatzschineria cameli]PWD91627.1 dephospho-CoA kinase [Ignatzschineria cameli]